MSALIETLIKGLGTVGFIVVLIISLLGLYALVVIIAKVFKVDAKWLGISLKNTTDDAPKSHAECTMRDDIADIVVAVKESAYDTFEIMYIKTRSRVMAAIDMALTNLKIGLEADYSNHYKTLKPNATQEDLNDNLAIYHILTEAIIKKVMADVRTYVFLDDIFNIKNADEWTEKRNSVISQILASLESEIDRYFPRRLLVSCSVPSDFLTSSNSKRSELISKTLSTVFNDCRKYTQDAMAQKEKIAADLRIEVAKIIHKKASQTPAEFESNLNDALS